MAFSRPRTFVGVDRVVVAGVFVSLPPPVFLAPLPSRFLIGSLVAGVFVSLPPPVFLWPLSRRGSE